MDLLEEQWKEFESIVVPDDAPEIQIKEMRQAFLAGMTVATNIILKAIEDKDLDTVNKIQNETIEHVRSFF